MGWTGEFRFLKLARMKRLRSPTRSANLGPCPPAGRLPYEFGGPTSRHTVELTRIFVAGLTQLPPGLGGLLNS